jgi:hypothetical protein
MRHRLSRSLPLALAAALLLASQALAEQLPDIGRVIAASRYSAAQKAALNEQLGLALSAGVPADSLARLTALSVARAVPPEHLNLYYQLLRRVRNGALPVAPFENKIAEGLAKRAPSEVILQVVLEKERNYLRARRLLVANIQKKQMFDKAFYQVLELSAEGLRRRLPEEGLARLFAVRDHSLEEMGRAVRAYLYVQAIRFPPDEGFDIVLTALQSGHFSECRSCLGQVIFTARSSGAPPRRIRDELVRGMKSGRDLVEISRTLCTAP